MRAAALAVLLACTHARTANRPAPHREAPSEEKGSVRVETPPGHPDLATGPESLLRPGAAAHIQAALTQRGYLGAHQKDRLDAATSAALRRFQRDENLAETGAPDEKTIRQLGLDPQQIFRPQAVESGAAR